MKSMQMLEPDDLLQAEDWVRPLVYHPATAQGEIVVNSISAYGLPINHPKWIRARVSFGSCWFGKKLKELDPNREYEFLRGDIPQSHRLDLKGVRKRHDHHR